MLPKLKEIFEAIEYLISKVGWPAWALKWILTTILVVILLLLLLLAADWISKLVMDSLKPRFYDVEQRKRANRRRRFAEYLVNEIVRINRKEDWDDYHFTELEAEVEVEGDRHSFRLLPFLKQTRSGLRREKSLSYAIKNSSEKIIQLEGDPGAGKSVALRHLALKMAKSASESRSLKSVIPLYINLKELSRDRRDEKIDRNLIESFVLKTLKRANDRNIEEFVDKEFLLGIEEGTWFFLFDSFDEIPEVLSSTEEDNLIKSYANAISDFLGGLSLCRGVVASRHYRGPGKSGWAKFRIMELSEARRNELIKNADLDANIEGEIKWQLEMAGVDIRELSKNPMLLGLLCVHMKAGNLFPESAYTVLATYLDNRLKRDRDRLKQRFNLDPKEVREISEKIAFCMAADHGLGLTPSRQSLAQSLTNLGMQVRDLTRFNTVLDGLEYVKLGRSENDDAVGASRLFTFAHRRFQEYFATCVVLREPDRITIPELLRDARWRETVVVTFQTQPKEKLTPLLNEAQRMLDKMVSSIPVEFKMMSEGLPEQAEKESRQGDESEKRNPTAAQFPWPAEAIHLLNLLQDGFSRRMNDLPDQIRQDAGTIVLSASEKGSPFDRTWALEIAGVAEQKVLVKLVRDAFTANRSMLKDVAYRQVSRLGQIPDDISKSINRALVNIFISGRLKRDYLATRAHLGRLDKAENFLSALQLLVWVPRIDLILHLALLLIGIAFFASNQLTQPGVKKGKLLSFSATLLVLLSISILLEVRGRILSLLIIYARIGVALLVGSVFVLEASRVTVMVKASIVPSLAVTWAYFALTAIRLGDFTRPIWWPFMPVVPFLIFVRKTKTIIKIIRDEFRKVSIIQAIAVLVVLGISSFLLSILASADRLYIFMLLGLLYTPFILLSLGCAWGWLVDQIKWHTRQKKLQQIEAQGFADLICQFRTGKFRCLIINEVRSQNVLSLTPDIHVLISELASIIDGRKAQSKQMGRKFILNLLFGYWKTETPIVVGETSIYDWYNDSYEKYRFLLSFWEGDIVDELFQLQNQLLSNRSEKVM